MWSIYLNSVRAANVPRSLSSTIITSSSPRRRARSYTKSEHRLQTLIYATSPVSSPLILRRPTRQRTLQRPLASRPADSSLSYSPYLPREYDDESRGFASSRQVADTTARTMQSAHPSPSFLVGGVPSNSIVATPRPLSIPSLLPNNGSPSERVYLASEADPMRHSNVPPNIQPGPSTSPQESALQ